MKVRSTRAARVAAALALIAAATGGGRTARRFSEQAPVVTDTSIVTMDEQESHGVFALPAATSVPAPAPAALAAGRLRPREVTAFAPYWSLDRSGGVDLRGVTTIAYFGVDAAADGSLVRTGNGWAGYQSQALVDLITRAHRAATRVVLTVKCFDASTLRSLATSPAAGQRLGRELADVAAAKRFDGVNLDFEGFGDGYRTQFTAFVAAVTKALRATDPSWQITIDTYATSAEVADGFFDVRALASIVDALFVMGYDMYSNDTASPNAPLPRYEQVMAAYVGQVAPSKVIWGMPFYGYDWPTQDNQPYSRAAGQKTPLAYSEIVAAGHVRYWDPQASVPWTAYEVGGQWHETYYDDPSSLALKAGLADGYRLRGVGAWALRMDDNDRTLIGALVGAVGAILRGPIAPAPLAPAPQPRPASRPKPAATSSSSPKPKASSSPSPSPSPSPKLLPLPLLSVFT